MYWPSYRIVSIQTWKYRKDRRPYIIHWQFLLEYPIHIQTAEVSNKTVFSVKLAINGPFDRRDKALVILGDRLIVGVNFHQRWQLLIHFINVNLHGEGETVGMLEGFGV